MRVLLPVVAEDRRGCDAQASELVVEKRTCARARLAVHVPEPAARQVLDAAQAERVAGRDDEALFPNGEPHDGDVAPGEHLIEVGRV